VFIGKCRTRWPAAGWTAPSCKDLSSGTSQNSILLCGVAIWGEAVP